MRLALKREPSSRDTSAEASATPPCTRLPAQRGWSSSTIPRAALVVTSGIPLLSMNSVSAAPAPEKKAPDPASTTGRSAAVSSATACATSSGGGTERASLGWPAGWGGAAGGVGAAKTSWGISR